MRFSVYDIEGNEVFMDVYVADVIGSADNIADIPNRFPHGWAEWEKNSCVITNNTIEHEGTVHPIDIVMELHTGQGKLYMSNEIPSYIFTEGDTLWID